MTNHEAKSVWKIMTAAALSATTVGVIGCAEEPPPPAPVVQAPPQPPPPPPAPTVTPIADLMAQLGIDERIKFPEHEAPDNDPARIAILEFFDAFARGDNKSVDKMVTAVDKFQLDDLVKSGDWKSTTDNIDQVEIQAGQSPYGDAVVLALFTVAGTFQPQLWQYAASETETATFEAVAAPPGIIDRLSGDDWIAAWFELIEEEMLLADQPDESLEKVKREFNEEGDESTADSPQPGGPLRGPGGPGGPPRRKEPPKNPIRPPRPGQGN